MGWHNVYVAPEDAEGPGDHRVVLDSAAYDLVESGRHAAPTIAGIVGLWTGVDRCLFDDDARYLPGARAARCFYRRVDAAEVEHHLRRRVLATSGGVPRPRDETADAAFVTDPDNACAVMARQWWELHRHRVVGRKEQADPFVPRQLTIKAALRMFFTWLRDTLRRAPRDLMDTAQNMARIRAAATVSKALFSEDHHSAYQVVVHARSGNRLPVGLRELYTQAQELDGQIVAVGGPGYRAQDALPDLSPMWLDYANAAFTLVDAGKRNAKLPPRDRDARPAVLSRPEQAVPSARAAYDVPASIATRVDPELQRIQPGDVVAVRRLRATLPEIAADDVMLRNEVAAVDGELATWSMRYERSFAGQVGAILDDARAATHRQIVEYLAELKEAEEYTPEPPPAGRGRAIWIVTLLLAGVVVPAVMLLLWLYAALIPWWTAVLLAVLVPLGWLAGAAITHGRHLWELEHARDITAALRRKYEVALGNLRQALLDLRALCAAYEQYRVYNPIIGAVLAEPFGPDPDEPHRPAAIAHGLPRSVRVAWAQATEASVGAVAERLRREIFQTGWLSSPWEAHQKLAGVRLNSYTLQQDDRSAAVFDLRGGGVAGTELERWSELLAAQGTSAEPGEERWRRLLDEIRRRDDLDEQLLSSVQELDRPPTTLRDFLAGADQPRDAGDHQLFHGGHFTGDAVMRGAHKVAEQDDPTEEGLGLSRVHVLVQLSTAVRAREFAATATPPPIVGVGRFYVPEGPRTEDDIHPGDGSVNGQQPPVPPPPPPVPPVPQADI
jgi:hypothetical protein